MTSTAVPLSASTREKQAFLADGMLIVVAIALAKLVLHCVFNNRYGYFRDEFDYMACGDHLAWGYVDQPPLLPFLVKIGRLALGDSLRSIRFFPALASSVAVIQAAVLARELGGRQFALLLAAVTVAVAPQYLSNGSLLTTNCLEPLLWMGCVYFAILAIKRNDPCYWLWFGVLAGIGMEEKFDCGAGLRNRGWTALDRTTPRSGQQVALAGRRCGLPDFLTQPCLETATSLAFCAAHAQHQGQRPRRCTVALPVLRPTDAAASPFYCADLDRGPDRVALLAAAEALPHARLVLPGRVRSFRRAEGKKTRVLGFPAGCGKT